jgi:hypothetical protein
MEESRLSSWKAMFKIILLLFELYTLCRECSQTKIPYSTNAKYAIRTQFLEKLFEIFSSKKCFQKFYLLSIPAKLIVNISPK